MKVYPKQPRQKRCDRDHKRYKRNRTAQRRLKAAMRRRVR